MKVLIINGSPRVNGNTSIAVNEMAKSCTEEGIETEVVQIGNKDIRGCIACGSCREKGNKNQYYHYSSCCNDVIDHRQPEVV